MIFGRRETFAIEAIPLGVGPGGDHAAAAATWTGLSIYVYGRNLLSHVNSEDRTASEYVNWPAVYLATWLVRSWDAIFHTRGWHLPTTCRNARDFADVLDERLLFDEVSDDEVDMRDLFVKQHAVRASAAGAAMPDVWISRDGPVVSVAWNDSMDGDVRFTLSRGERDVPVADFADAVHGFISWVDRILAGVAGAEEDRAPLREWLESYDAPKGALSGLLSEVGLSPERVESVRRLAGVNSVEELFGVGPEWFAQGTRADSRQSAIAVAFRCVAPVVTDEDLVRLRACILSVPKNESGFSALTSLAKRVRTVSHEHHDYVRGYRLARGVRSALGNEIEPLDMEQLFEDLQIPIADSPLSERSIDGGCVCDERHGPQVFVNSSSERAGSPWGRRMVLAHELCHLLFDRDHATQLGIMSGPWAPPRVERTANAFAAELLLPLAGIVDSVGSAWEQPTDATIQTLMNRYTLGITVVTEHLRNMRRPTNRR